LWLHPLQGLLDLRVEEITEEGRAPVAREVLIPGRGVRLVVKMEGRVQRKEALPIGQLAVSLTMEKKKRIKSTAATVASLKLSPMVGMPPKGSGGKFDPISIVSSFGRTLWRVVFLIRCYSLRSFNQECLDSSYPTNHCHEFSVFAITVVVVLF
jgi:hypothetical protein